MSRPVACSVTFWNCTASSPSSFIVGTTISPSVVDAVAGVVGGGENSTESAGPASVTSWKMQDVVQWRVKIVKYRRSSPEMPSGKARGSIILNTK